ncbi:hypothetical protein KCP70_17620 [Salmonella enterica subsp. enterica]|nr:hypothetical protein KCP70_17620 [Salmonella enterica subsp. enterica]
MDFQTHSTRRVVAAMVPGKSRRITTLPRLARGERSHCFCFDHSGRVYLMLKRAIPDTGGLHGRIAGPAGCWVC